MLQPFVPLVFYAWVVVVIVLFSQNPARKALLLAVIGGTLLLPYPSITGPAGLQISKVSVTSIGCLIGTFLFYSERLSAFKPSPLDIPALILCMWVVPSQITNGLSPLSPVINHVLLWGIPYFLGRIHLNDLKGLKQLSIGIFVGGLLYAPLCLWESRMSPTLHNQIYGIWGFRDWAQSIRLGGFRPEVFMGHGLALGVWMAAAAVVGLWFWQFKVFKRFWNQPIALLAIGLVITHILCRSTGAYLLSMTGICILIAALRFRTALPLLALILYISAYVSLGATGDLFKVPAVQQKIELSYAGGPGFNEREGSYWYRVRNEQVISAHARVKAFAGWGGSGGNFTINPRDGSQTVPDSLWGIMYSVFGAPGLFGFMATLLLPAFIFVLRYPARLWKHPKLAPVAVLPVINTLFVWDCTVNAFPNVVFLVISGGLIGLLSGPKENLASETLKLKMKVSGSHLPQPTSAAKKRMLAAKRASVR